ncbi:MAG: hypothetical protein Q8N67_04835 [Candidatus Omnitrophota bacterium]|nr:hypothetical protein [Candidatus Omnitrophota bacterium]
MGMTTSNQLKLLLKERDALADKLSGYRHILRGTIIKRGNICGKAICRCKRKHDPFLHGPYNYLSHRSRKSINMIFLNKKKLPYATKGVKEYNEVIVMLYRISEINFEILRYHYERLS